MSYYKIIQGERYDKALIDLAKSLAVAGEGYILNLEAVQGIWKAAQDGQGLTEIEEKTILFLIQVFPPTKDALNWLSVQIPGLYKDPSLSHYFPVLHKLNAYSPMNKDSSTSVTSLARTFYESSIRDFVEKSYAAYQADVEFLGRFWEAFLIDRDEGNWPKNVVDSLQYFVSEVEAQDRGSVEMFKVPISSRTQSEWRASGAEEMGSVVLNAFEDLVLIVIRTSTDGDDGWVELFDVQGNILGSGRSYLELVSWGAPAEIRVFAATGGFPEALKTRQDDTLWGK